MDFIIEATLKAVKHLYNTDTCRGYKPAGNPKRI